MHGASNKDSLCEILKKPSSPDQLFHVLCTQSHEDVEKMGVANYNAECRKIVMRYSSEWENIVTRMGRWIDFKNDYKTLYPWFMESIWYGV